MTPKGGGNPFLFLILPFAIASVATVFLYFACAQAFEGLRTQLSFSDVWMEADRNALLQLNRCLDLGESECNLVAERLKRPLAYQRANLERDKPNPDQALIDKLLQESGLDYSPVAFRLHWYEKLSRLAGVEVFKNWQRTPRKTNTSGDVSKILALSEQAKILRAQQPVNQRELADFRKMLDLFGSGLEANKVKFDAQAIQALVKVGRFLSIVFFSSALVMFLVACLVFRSMIRRWQRTEGELLDHERQLTHALSLNVERLELALKDKTTLLQEVHHRVKNNLSMVGALLGLEAANCSDTNFSGILQSVGNRIQSMAFVHERLCYRGMSADLDLNEYVDALSRHLLASLGATPDIHFHSKVTGRLSLEKAVPCALILNELLTNSLKHGLPTASAREIWLDLAETDGKVKLQFRDSGGGFPPGFEAAKASTLGMRLIKDLTKQIDGTARWSESEGATFSMNFSA